MRIHWLPPGQKHSDICDFIKEKSLSTSIKFLKTLEESINVGNDQEIKTGVIRIQVEYKLDDHEKILESIGIHSFNNYRTLIELSGHPPKCIYCKKFGHIKKTVFVKVTNARTLLLLCKQLPKHSRMPCFVVKRNRCQN